MEAHEQHAFGAFWTQAHANKPAGKVAVWMDDGQEGGWIEWMTPADAEAHEAAEDAKAAAEDAAWAAQDNDDNASWGHPGCGE